MLFNKSTVVALLAMTSLAVASDNNLRVSK